MVSYWRFRMGARSEYIEQARLGNFIAIGWNEVGDLYWAKDISFEEAKEKLERIFKERYPKKDKPRSISKAVGQLLRFTKIEEDDIILVPDLPKRTLLIGRIKGNYFFDETATGFCDYKHKRNVEWIHEVPKQQFSEKLRNSIGSLQVLVKLDKYKKEIDQLIETKLEESVVEEDGEYEIPLEERKVITQPGDPTIKDLCERIEKGKLIVRPEFQRQYVWRNRPKLKGKLIESVLLRFPIPVIYTAEESDGKEIVVDGQQRLLTFYEFRKKEGFQLKGLTVLKELNGYTYTDLGTESDPLVKKLAKSFGDLQDRIDNYPLRAIKILKESQKDIKFDMFERLNRGSVTLREQELRNCIFHGNFNEFIKKLRKNKDFLKLQKLSEPHERMDDAERILRFFAFCDKTERGYKSPVRKFLNDYMGENRALPHEKLEKKEHLFKKSVEICLTVFGEHAFRRAYLGDEEDPNGRFDTKINEGLFDVQMYGFSEYEKRDIIDKAQVVRDSFLDLICGDEKFIETIEKGTYDTTKVKKRTEMWFSKLREVLGYPKNDRRLYTYEEKKALFDSNPICALCKNKISFIDDAHVDHIERYSEGGKTKIKNAQLTHRYCNLRKG